jgi:hypothetical protein
MVVGAETRLDVISLLASQRGVQDSLPAGTVELEVPAHAVDSLCGVPMSSSGDRWILGRRM